MSLDVAYSYCTKLIEEEKLAIDKQVQKNRFELKFAVLFPFLPFPFPMPRVPFFPVEGFSPQQIVKNTRNRAEEAVAKRMTWLSEAVDDCREEDKKYKVSVEMSSRLSKVSKKVRKDPETSKILDKQRKQLEDGSFHAGRGARKLPGTKNVFYLRAGNRARLFFRYSKAEEGRVEVIGESNKKKEREVIDNLKQNYE